MQRLSCRIGLATETLLVAIANSQSIHLPKWAQPPTRLRPARSSFSLFSFFFEQQKDRLVVKSCLCGGLKNIALRSSNLKQSIFVVNCRHDPIFAMKKLLSDKSLASNTCTGTRIQARTLISYTIQVFISQQFSQ